MARFVDSKIDFENMSKNKITSKSTNTLVIAYINCWVNCVFSLRFHSSIRLTRNHMASWMILDKYPSLFYKIKSPSLRSGDFTIL